MVAKILIGLGLLILFFGLGGISTVQGFIPKITTSPKPTQVTTDPLAGLGQVQALPKQLTREQEIITTQGIMVTAKPTPLTGIAKQIPLTGVSVPSVIEKTSPTTEFSDPTTVIATPEEIAVFDRRIAELKKRLSPDIFLGGVTF